MTAVPVALPFWFAVRFPRFSYEAVITTTEPLEVKKEELPLWLLLITL